MKKYSLLMACLLILSSCYKENNWIADNMTATGKKYPVIIAMFLSTTTPNAGAVVNVDLRYWSQDRIKEVKLYETIGTTRKEIQTKAYQANFQADTRSDKMEFSYTVPNGTPANTRIVLTAEVINENGTSTNRSANLNTR